MPRSNVETYTIRLHISEVNILCDGLASIISSITDVGLKNDLEILKFRIEAQVRLQTSLDLERWKVDRY